MSAQANLDTPATRCRGTVPGSCSRRRRGASKQTAEGVVLSDVLRGALVGLFVGVLIAAFLENRRSSSRA